MPFRSFEPRSGLRPTLWKIQALLGMAEKRTGSSKSALADLEKAFPKLKEEKIQIDAGMELIEIYSGAGDLDKAAATVSASSQLISHECRKCSTLPTGFIRILPANPCSVCPWWLRNLPGCIR